MAEPDEAPAGRSNGSRRHLANVIGLAISALFIAGVVWWALDQPPPALPDEPGEIAALGGAIAAYALATALRGERAHRLLVLTGADSHRPDAYGLTVVGYAGNNILPARGGDAVRVVLQAPRAATSMRNVIGVLLAERILDAGVLLALFAVLAYGVLRGIDTPSVPALGIVLGIGALAVLVGLLLFRARGRLPAVQRALAWLAPVAQATRRLAGRGGGPMLALTVLIWLAEGLTYFAASGATELAMTPVEALYVVALASVFVLIPSGPGYAGTLDAAIVFGARAVGATGAAALSYLLVLRFVLVVPITLAGLGILLARYGGFSRLRGAGATG